MNKYAQLIVVLAVCCWLVSPLYADGILTAGITQLDDAGSSGNIAEWTLAGDYDAPAGTFTIGGAGLSWNQLAIKTGQTFTTAGDLLIGPNRSDHNSLYITNGGTLNINGNFRTGQGSISYRSIDNLTQVFGDGSVMNVTDNLYVGNGTSWTSVNNTLAVKNGGIVVVDSDKDGIGGLSLLSHWSYGNSWLELDGGQLLWFGNQTGSFSEGMLSSIKVWDDQTATMQRVAAYQSTNWFETEYMDLLQIAYVSDAATASSLGVDEEYIGFTVVQNIPEPTTMALLLASGLLCNYRKR